MTRPALPASSRRSVDKISAAASRLVTATASAAAPSAAAIATSKPSATRSRAANDPSHAAEAGRVGEQGRGGVGTAAYRFGQRFGPGTARGQLAGGFTFCGAENRRPFGIIRKNRGGLLVRGGQPATVLVPPAG